MKLLLHLLTSLHGPTRKSRDVRFRRRFRGHSGHPLFIGAAPKPEWIATSSAVAAG